MGKSEEQEDTNHIANNNLTYNTYLTNKLVNIIIIIVILWFGSVVAITGGFLWYLNQYEYIDEVSTITTDIQQETDNGGNNIITEKGIINGEPKGNSNINNEKEKQN